MPSSIGRAPEIPPNATAECIALARAFEPDRYYAALLAPEPHRAALIALAAFAAELRRIPATVKEPMMGEIRLQWWRDTIATLARSEAVGHPIADTLGSAMTSFRLPPLLLVAMTEARAFDLYADPMPDEASYEGYLAKTEAIPFALALRILGLPEARADAIAADAGRAYGMARSHAGLAALAARGRIIVPQSRLVAAGLTAEDILAGRGEKSALQRLFTQGCADIDTKRAAVWPQMALLSASERVGLLPLAVVPAYCRALRRPAAQTLTQAVEVSALARISRIAAAHYLGRWG